MGRTLRMDPADVPVTPEEFHAIFRRLALALRLTEQDAAMVSAYYDALNDLPADAVARGARDLAREPGRKFFPTSAEWRECALTEQKQILRATLPAHQETPWQAECETCDDTGWERFECTGDQACGRKNRHALHTYVRICGCRANNRTYQRHHGPASFA